MTRLWETLVRWRTWFVNLLAAVLIILPELLNAPEVLAVIPVEYHKYVFVGALLLNILMRPRAAATKDDPEVQLREELKRTEGPAVVEVKTGGLTKAVIRA